METSRGQVEGLSHNRARSRAGRSSRNLTTATFWVTGALFGLGCLHLLGRMQRSRACRSISWNAWAHFRRTARSASGSLADAL